MHHRGSLAIFSFFQGIFGPLRNEGEILDRTSNAYIPPKLFITTVNHAVQYSILLK